VAPEDQTPKTCKDRFAWWDFAVSPEAGTAVAVFELSGWDDGKLPGYHFGCFSPPGNGAGILYASASGDHGPLEVKGLRACEPRVYQCDLGCGYAPPPKAGYNGGNFAGHVNVTVPALPENSEECRGCVEQWIAQQPEVTYTEWGPCEQVLQVLTGGGPKCERSRKKITRIYEINSCTEERRLKSETEETQTESCECQLSCEVHTLTTNYTEEKLLEPTWGKNPDCGDFGLVSLGKDDDLDDEEHVTTMDAYRIIVKGGKCDQFLQPDFYAYLLKPSPDNGTTWIKAGRTVDFDCGFFEKDISHVEYCGCPD
jgi:hypothetical protein